MAKRESDQPVPPAKRADVVRLNIGGKHFETSRLTLEQCPFFMHYLEERGCPMALDDEGRIFVDRDGGLFHILLQSLRTGKRPPQRVVAESRDALLDECEFFQMDWLSSKIRGEISHTDLRPADRLLREAELAARAEPQSYRLLDVFKDDMCPLPPLDLQLPLLFDAVREQPRLQGTYHDFIQRLDEFSGGLVESLKDIDGLVVAGGSVLAALTDSFRPGDLDIFLLGSPEDGERKLHLIMKAVQENQEKRLGADSSILVLRSNAAVTFMRIGSGCGSPPVQVILVVYDSIQQLLIHFDVAARPVKLCFRNAPEGLHVLYFVFVAAPRRCVEDCCCFAWDIDKGKVVCTPRGQRALKYGCNVADNGLFGGLTYTRRLERYADRAFSVAVPGYAKEEVSRDLLGATYVFVMHRDLLLRIDSKTPDSRIMELAHRDATNKVKVCGGVLYASSIRGFARLVVLATPEVKVSEKEAPELCWCANHRKATAVPNSETGAVSLVSGLDGQYLVLCDAAAVETKEIIHEDANYTESPLAAIYSLIEAKLNHDILDQRETAQADTDGWWTGGAMQRIGSSMARRHGQKARSLADETIETRLNQNEPLSFVYDFVTCKAPFQALVHCLDAARVIAPPEPRTPTDNAQADEERFRDNFGIYRQLSFRTFTERKCSPGDWWESVYS